MLQWGFLALRGDMHFHLVQTEEPENFVITTQLDRGTMMRNFSSRWVPGHLGSAHRRGNAGYSAWCLHAL